MEEQHQKHLEDHDSKYYTILRAIGETLGDVITFTEVCTVYTLAPFYIPTFARLFRGEDVNEGKFNKHPWSYAGGFYVGFVLAVSSIIFNLEHPEFLLKPHPEILVLPTITNFISMVYEKHRRLSKKEDLEERVEEKESDRALGIGIM
jgi:hypothetical protein